MPAAVRAGARALNKPLLIIGIDRKLAGLNFLIAVIVGANDGLSQEFGLRAIHRALGNRPAAHTHGLEHFPGDEPGAATEGAVQPR